MKKWILSLQPLLVVLLFSPILLTPLQGAAATTKSNQRLIVELNEPALARWSALNRTAHRVGKLDTQNQSAQNYIASLHDQQQQVFSQIKNAVPNVALATYRTENNQLKEHRYQVVLNGFVVEAGDTNIETTIASLKKIPGIKSVTREKSYTPTMYASLPLINAPAAWNNAQIGGVANAGAGIKIASMDSGVHKDAPMFGPSGFVYPYGYPQGGLGLTSNNNGKIIASRAYYRSDDPPDPLDNFPWPGASGQSHGVHTAGTAAGNRVQAEYQGNSVDISGVAPAAWIMSYKVLYKSVSNEDTFSNPEGIAALEDIVKDGADVVNCSWGGGPTSIGGVYDPLDTAKINTWNAGVFVAMAAGNSGFNKGTIDHPSPDYIVVASTTSGGSFIQGSFSVTHPQPVPNELSERAIIKATFGPTTELDDVFSFSFVPAKSINPDNISGCSPWSGKPFTGNAALIRRGECSFSDKVIHAESAGAEFVVFYNNRDDDLAEINCGSDSCDEIGIRSVLVAKSIGEDLENWYNQHGDTAKVQISYAGLQIGNTADVVADTSSRGPGVGDTLKPDIAAPGEDILSQGYASNLQDEAVHLGYGQVSGTSMATPHVAGAAAILKQRYPLWSNTEIKSALMSTAKFMHIYNGDGSPAQPLDIGAGRLDLEKALNPGVILTPPSIGFGNLQSPVVKSQTVEVRNVTASPLTYQVKTVYTGGGFDAIPPLAGFTVSPTSLTLEPYQSAVIEVTFNSAEAQGVGDNQGYVVLTGNGPTASFPVWARITKPNAELADVLLLDMDGSSFDPLVMDTRQAYIDALNALGITYDGIDVEPNAYEVAVPEAAEIIGYRAIVMFSGTSEYATLGAVDLDRLTEYANSGGFVLAMGQNMASKVLNPRAFFYQNFLSEPVSSSVTLDSLPAFPIVPTDNAPVAFRSLFLDFGNAGDGAGNQVSMDEFPFESHSSVFSVLKYPGPQTTDKGVVLKLQKEQPSLEAPGISHLGRVAYAGFGLEGINNNTGGTSREELFKIIFDWALDQPTVTIKNDSEDNELAVTEFEAIFSSNIKEATAVSYLWDMGDGTGQHGPYQVDRIAHTFERCGDSTITVEVVDSYGNKAVGSTTTTIAQCHTATNPSEKKGSGALSLSLLLILLGGVGVVRRLSKKRLLM